MPTHAMKFFSSKFSFFPDWMDWVYDCFFRILPAGGRHKRRKNKNAGIAPCGETRRYF
jgi:hypothetical protein